MIAQGPHGRDTPNPALPAGSKYSHDPAFPPWVCRNPSCKSYGKSHPNCQCGRPGSRGDRANTGAEYPLAHGGVVERFCSHNQAHDAGCEYFADGGQVLPAQAPAVDPEATLGHAAIEHGLLGLLKNVGRPNMVDPEKHARVLHEAKNQHEWRQNPKEMKLPKTMGTRLGDHLADGNHDKAAEHLHGHALSGSAPKSHLKEIMGEMAQPVMSMDPHPEGFRGAVDYLSSSRRGQDRLKKYVKTLLTDTPNKDDLSTESVDELRGHLQSLDENPDQLLDVGGALGHYLPAHSAQLSATAAQAITYLKTLKPAPSQRAPLDRVTQPSPGQTSQYNRQLAIAEQPLLALSHLKNGTLQPQDFVTVQTLYPGLFKSMKTDAFEEIADSMAKDQPLPYSKRRSLSLLLGQPLDSTLTPASMLAIMNANASQQADQTGPKQSKASAVELKQIDKVDNLYKTPLQARQIDKKD